ncbi:MAG: hypothetical protein AAGD07_24345, partial [Planctomycetota bacterium]
TRDACARDVCAHPTSAKSATVAVFSERGSAHGRGVSAGPSGHVMSVRGMFALTRLRRSRRQSPCSPLGTLGRET